MFVWDEGKIPREKHCVSSLTCNMAHPGCCVTVYARHWQEAAAAAAGHLAQYKAMCAASDEALKAMKEAHEGYKQEAAIATEATEKEVEQIKQKLTEAEAEVSKKRGVDAEEEKKRLAQEEVLISENSKLKEETGTLNKQLELNEQQVLNLKNNVKEDHHQQWPTAKTLSYKIPSNLLQLH